MMIRPPASISFIDVRSDVVNAALQMAVYPALTPSDTTWALQPIDDTLGKTFRADVEAELEASVLMTYDWASNEKGTMPLSQKRIATARAIQATFQRWKEDTHRVAQIQGAVRRTGVAITASNFHTIVPNR
jgi:hypothetical protein